MQWRTLGHTGARVSAVSLGTEYLINRPREHVVAVIHEAIARGINYFDLFYAQPAFRDDMGAAFAGRREGVMLTAHLGAIGRDDQYDRTRDVKVAEPYFLDYLKRYDTDYVDVLFIHNVNSPEEYEEAMNGGLLESALRYRDQGKARWIGFSGHWVSTSLAAVRSGVVDVLMFPINLAGHAVAGRKELYQECAARGVGLVAMKPYGGGRLLRPERAAEVKSGYLGAGEGTTSLQWRVAITPAQCLSYVLTQPGLSTVVPGCKDLAELEAALAVLEATAAERDYSPVLADFAEYAEGECVYCNHCLPCPSSIDVGETIRLLDEANGHPSEAQRAAYAALPAPASDCSECGACADRCPFGVDTPALIAQAAGLYE
ncbi:MAG: aldo/keto reductase [Anaerolineae bacterium]